VTFAGVINGTGNLVQLGSGTLVLNGNNSYSGGTTISAGTPCRSATAERPEALSDNSQVACSVAATLPLQFFWIRLLKGLSASASSYPR
jgi:autotransporter-associated beta strand protein